MEYQSRSGNLLIELSDHLLQFLVIEGFVKKRKQPVINLYKRDFKNFNEREFNSEVISSLNWDEICQFHLNDPNLSCQKFYDAINLHLDEYAPYRKVTKKEIQLLQKPWITNEILSKCKHRDSLLKTITKETDKQKLTSLHSEYKKLRNEITSDKRKSKKEHFHAFFEKNKQKN